MVRTAVRGGGLEPPREHFPVSPSSWCVCQFHHPRKLSDFIIATRHKIVNEDGKQGVRH